MLKQTVEYTDFDDNRCAETLYFNLTKTELAENAHLTDRLEKMQKMFGGEKRQLETSEIQQLLDLVKTIMRISYGVRSADGKRFIKTEEQWVEFTQTAVYDEFLISMFTDPDKMFAFMYGIMPADMREQAKVEAERLMSERTNQSTDIPTPPPAASATPVDMPITQANPSVQITMDPNQSAGPQPTQEQMAAYMRDQQARGLMTQPNYLQG
ncbi:gp065 [Rhodococcus phage ReqiPoco6]|uniref:Gp065 n=1 Tax=Rhodococcus phage ReqiPoco6 TaxID=691964 RepID=D4P7T3_9CAUD|nr:gp065 [Rhodococcus phage ReqiPoco6]ADD81063.1 gp065 [Rhodococcus phage ReqiPoco6]